MVARAAVLGDGGTNGATVTTTNTGRKAGVPVDSVTIGSGATLTWDTTRAYHGNASMRLTTGAAANAWVRWESMYRPASGAAQVATVWLYQTAFTPTSSIVFVANSSLQRICEFRVSSAGRIRALNSAGTQILETTNAISLNTWVRIDCLFTPHASAGVLQVKLYNNPASSTPTESTSVFTAQNLRQTQVDQVYIGDTISAASQSCWLQAHVTDGSPPPFGQVGWVASRWLGAVTDTSASVAARILGGASARLVVSTSPSLTSPSYSSSQSPDSDGTVRMTATGLTAGTQYYYAVEVDGTIDPDSAGSFRTAPTPGSEASFQFIAAACAATNSNAAVFDAIVTANPDFMIHLGDLHYQDISTNNETAYHAAYDRVMASPRQRALFGTVPTPYIWSDHDATGDNGDGTAASIPAANAVYRSRVPAHADMPSTTGTYFSFVRGRVKFVCTDGRSFASPIAATDNSSKTKLGTTQRTWLITELTDPDYPVKIWAHEDAISNGSTFTGDDTWSAYSTERATILAAIAGERVAYVCADLHMVAADDGSNVPAVGAASGLPVHVCGPLDQTSYLGNGTYSAGRYPASNDVAVNQYGWFEVTDTGDAIELLYEGRSADGTVRVTQTTTWTGLAETITGDLAATLPALTGVGSASVAVTGTAAATLPGLTGSASAVVAVSGSGAATLPPLTGQASGTVAVTAQAAATLPPLTAEGTGTVTVLGSAAAVLPALTGDGAASVSVAGTLTAQLPALTAAGTAVVESDGGFLAATLPALTGQGFATVTVTAAAAATLPALTGTGTAEVVPSSGTLAAVLPALTSAGVATVRVTGILAATLPALVGGPADSVPETSRGAISPRFRPAPAMASRVRAGATMGGR
ncbi:alkaline phosphatase D family protein [Sphaerisporangium sp. TRM90804]|uniref:alkaline phosphatase D family protein n=1 Tax=Sphaerisporangium sp. TRM90804 TaxID=3031113 RepID=UPI00244BABC5|nr:alkaline phosphatase D family protein [Sphaerisporangium sp. TRM90804]MDH2429321.1 alkaline phosphatase D family protein [Sphaerisporangium sp. TRM90804]